MAMSVVYGNAFGGIISENRGGTVRTYVPDTLGSTIAMMDSTGTETDSWTYWPYGEVRTRTGTNSTPFTFVGTLGYFADIVSSFTYVRARFLRSDLARWLTVDPLWPKEAAYSYVDAGPSVSRDPSGLSLACIGFGICAGVALVAALIGCLGDPSGLADCVSTWCCNNPAVCGAIFLACGALLLACLGPAAVSALKAILASAGVAVAGVATASAGSGAGSSCGGGGGNTTIASPCYGGDNWWCEGVCISERLFKSGCWRVLGITYCICSAEMEPMPS